MKSRIGLTLLLTFYAVFDAAAACPDPALPRAIWEPLQRHDFKLANDADVQRAAIALLSCLDEANPEIRDGLAYEALTAWMRERRVTPATARTLLRRLSERLESTDPNGFGRPFAALVLAEVARMDRIESYLTADEYDALVRTGSRYLTDVRDYRGYDEREGWRHGIAHAADLLMQLALNPRTMKPQLDSMLAAIATQVAPPTAHFYVYGESARLARPVLFIAQRKLHSEEEWRRWLAALTSPASLRDWQGALRTQTGLAQRHNTTAFLTSLFASVQRSDDAALKAHMLGPVTTALDEL